jgi:hypothetical protein
MLRLIYLVMDVISPVNPVFVSLHICGAGQVSSYEEVHEVKKVTVHYVNTATLCTEIVIKVTLHRRSLSTPYPGPI